MRSQIIIFLFVLFISMPFSAFAIGQTRGEVIYQGYCVVCHGATGKGDGVSAPALIPGPPDFTSQEFKSSFDKDRVWEAVLGGSPGTQMEGFEDILSSDDVGMVIEHIMSFK